MRRFVINSKSKPKTSKEAVSPQLSAEAQLARIRYAVDCVSQSQRPPSPRLLLAAGSGAFAFFAIDCFEHLAYSLGAEPLGLVGGGLQVACAAIAFVSVMRRSKLSRTWDAELSKRLLAYEPRDLPAMLDLQTRIANEARIGTEAVRAWLEVEAAALRRQATDQPWHAVATRKL